MKSSFFKMFGLIAVAAMGLSACESAVVSDGTCSVEEKADAKTVLENLDTTPLGEDGVKAIAAGCKSSKTDKEQFMIGLLGDLSIDPACSSDGDLQNIVDNWEGADLSNVPGTCSEEGPGPDISPDPELTAITAAYDVFSIVGRGHFLSVGFSEPIKTDTAVLKLSALLFTSTDADGKSVATFGNLATDEATWTDDRKGLLIPITPHLDPTDNVQTTAGDYEFTIKADGDSEGHKLDYQTTFQIKVSDKDGDGVRDEKDLCPATPAGEEVGPAGCPPLPPAAVDGDMDGVEDSADKCPGTLKGMAVDKDGCMYVYTMIPGYIFTKFLHQLEIVSTTPADGAKNVNVNTNIEVSFDVGVNANSLKEHFKLLIFTPLGWFNVPVDLKVADSSGKNYTFKPVEPLKKGAAYAIVVKGGVSTNLGLSPEDVSTTFETMK